MIRAFVGAIAMLLVAGAGAVGPSIPDRRGVAPLAVAGTSAVPAARDTEGSDSTPGVVALPQLGSAGFVCGPDWEVRPFFDLGSAIATEAVTIRAGALTRRNFSYQVVGRLHGRPALEQEFSRARELMLPFGDYRAVSFTIRQDTEAREIVGTVHAELVAGTFAVRGVRQRLSACYVRRWWVRMDVRPN
jgi:hypothetical protein